MPRTPRRMVTALTVVAAASSTLWLAPAEAATPRTTYQDQAYAATNQQRAKHGLPKLSKQDCVQKFAERQATRMAQQKRMFHQDLSPILRACGLSRVGENVAYGYKSGGSVVNDGWMNSAGHRANILNPRYRLMGLGARQADNGRWYTAQVFGRNR